jgi:hypothetical protein
MKRTGRHDLSQEGIGDWINANPEDQSELHRRILSACRMIDRFHSVPLPTQFNHWIVIMGEPHEQSLTSRCVEIRSLPPESADDALYHFSNRTRDEALSWGSHGDRNLRPRLELNLKCLCPELAVVHECFHLLDYELLHETRNPLPAGTRAYQAMLSMIKGTLPHRQNEHELQKARLRYGRLQLIRDDVDASEFADIVSFLKVATYYSNLQEAAARYYSQVIFDSGNSGGGNPADIFSSLEHSRLRLYLPTREVKLFRRSLVLLLRCLGWKPTPGLFAALWYRLQDLVQR